MKKIIIEGDFIFACITDVNCQYLLVSPRINMRTKSISGDSNVLDVSNTQRYPYTYHRFPFRGNLKRLKKSLGQIMFYKLDGYTELEKLQVEESINAVLKQNVNGLIILYSFIYNRFPESIIYSRFSTLNKAILKTFNRKSPIYIAAYNSLIRLGEDVSHYHFPIITDRLGNTTAMPFVPFD